MTSTYIDAVRLHQLRADLQDAVATYGRRSSRTQAAFERLVREAAEGGRPLDALRSNSPIEHERFFALCLPGPDGHVFFDGGDSGFRLNTGKRIRPQRWWWMHVHGGQLDPKQDVVPTCGERACINPEHCVQDRATARMRYPVDRILGALQTGAMRLGRTPTSREWDEKLHGRPSAAIVRLRLGTWHQALRAAGLPMPTGAWREFSDAECIATIRRVRDELGSWPTQSQYRAWRARQAEPIDVPAASTLQRHFGAWSTAMARASRGR